MLLGSTISHLRGIDPTLGTALMSLGRSIAAQGVKTRFTPSLHNILFFTLFQNFMIFLACFSRILCSCFTHVAQCAFFLPRCCDKKYDFLSYSNRKTHFRAKRFRTLSSCNKRFTFAPRPSRFEILPLNRPSLLRIFQKNGYYSP